MIGAAEPLMKAVGLGWAPLNPLSVGAFLQGEGLKQARLPAPPSQPCTSARFSWMQTPQWPSFSGKMGTDSCPGDVAERVWCLLQQGFPEPLSSSSQAEGW